MASCAACNATGAKLHCPCKTVSYCSTECQKGHWPGHKAAHRAAEAAGAAAKAAVPAAVPASAAPAAAGAPGADAASGGGGGGGGGGAGAPDCYPSDPLIPLHAADGEPGATFTPPPRAESGARTIFVLRPREDRLHGPQGATVVPLALFREQLTAFTFSAFSAFTPDVWRNVCVAGGAVLASLLPLERTGRVETWRKIRAGVLPEAQDFLPHLRHHPGDGMSLLEQARYTPAGYLQRVRWPSSDVDLFIHGLTAREADAKLMVVLSCITKAFRAQGSPAVSYVRTPNTVTVDAGLPHYRKVQVVTRLYKDVGEVINTFDLDCCCVAYDGAAAWGTQRSRAAINAKRNTVNLMLRGAAYENRLVKYAQRGFGIVVPGLNKGEIDGENLAVKMGKSSWGGNSFVGSGFSWDKWQDASGTLLRILLMEQIAISVGYFEDAFPGRKKRDGGREDMVSHFVLLPPVSDTYPMVSLRGGKETFTATASLTDLVGASAKSSMRVSWQPGSMPRIPMTMEKWTEGVYKGAKRRSRWGGDEDWEARAAARKVEADKKVAEEAAAREAEKEAIRRESRAAVASMAAEKTSLAARLEAMRKTAAEAEHKAALAASTVKLLQEDLAAAGGCGGASDCVVCMSAPKNALLLPCRHMTACEQCAASLLKSKMVCPICRERIDSVTRVWT